MSSDGRALALGAATLPEIDARLARLPPGDVVLVDALAHAALPDVVQRLRARGLAPRIRVGDERITRALAGKLRELGITSIESDLDGDEAAHDRANGAGSWRTRLGSLRASRESGLGARARVRVGRAAIAGLATLVELLDRIASDVVLVEEPGLGDDERRRVLEIGAGLDRVQFSGFALHGPSPSAGPVPITPALVHALSRGVRMPHAEAGTLAVPGPALDASATRAGGLRALGRALEAASATATELPWCMAGRGRATAPSAHGPGCAGCPLGDRCGGLPSALAARWISELGPRASWRPTRTGARVRLLETSCKVLTHFAIPSMVARFEALGRPARVGGSVTPDDDLVITWDFQQALAVVDDPALGASARVVVGDFHMLEGRDAWVARARSGWPDERIEVFSAYPSFQHLFRRSGVPLERLSYRPFPVGPIEPRVPGTAGLAGGIHLRDWPLLEEAARRLGPRCPHVRVVHEGAAPLASVGGLEAIGYLELDDLVDAVARARFVVLPIAWDRDMCAGGTLMALATACGRPVVATRVPMALDHLREGVDALLVDPGDADGMADALLRVASDDALCERLSEGARRRAQRTSAAAWADELVHGAVPPADLGLRAWA